MAVSPIDISMMQRLTDVAQMRQNEITKPEVQQTVITREIEKQTNANSEQVVKKEDANKSDTEHDASEKGRNEYFYLGGKRKKKEEAGKVTIKGTGGFDMKI
ncbi:MAG: hypothetical protein ACI4AQ_07810 [Lachnospiraceae bacterium]